MVTRGAKLALLAAVALFYALIVFNNLTDFESNLQFVRHVLSMDTTFPGNRGMVRALPWPAAHLAFYWGIIAWEMLNALLLGWGTLRLLGNLRSPAAEFNAAKKTAIAALTLSLLMWLGAFLAIGGEWFLMWQSHLWNGQSTAGRNFAVAGIVLIVLLQPDRDQQP